MAVTFTNLGANSNPDINAANDATSYSNASWTPPTSGLLLVFVYAQGSGSGTAVTPTASGNGLTWNLIDSRAGGLNRVYLFAADLSGSAAGQTTFDYGTALQACMRASFIHAANVDLSGGVAAAIVQTAKTGGGTGLSVSVSLAAASAADNRSIFGVYHTTNEDIVPGASWTEIDDLGNTNPGADLMTAHSGSVFVATAEASWATSNSYGILAAEIKAGAVTPTGIAGTASVTLAHVTSNATGTAPSNGALDVSLVASSLLATGTLAIAGQLSVPLANATSAGTGEVATFAGEFSAQLAGVSLTASGSVGNANAGQLDSTLDGVAGSITGVVSVAGQASATLDSVTATANAGVAIAAALNASLANVTVSASGASGTMAAGEASITLNPISVASTATLPIVGQASIALAILIVTGTGEVPATGSFASTLDEATLTAEASGGGIALGQATIALDGVGATSIAVVVIVGAISIHLSGVTLAANNTPLNISVVFGFVFGPKPVGTIRG